MKTYLYAGLLGLMLSNCTDPVELESNFNSPELVVDAWLTDRSEQQTIRLSLSQDYYRNALPPGVTDAEVIVCRESVPQTCFSFIHQDSGRYVWTPQPGQKLGEVGDEFVLGIQRGEERFGSQAAMYRVPAIDSIAVRFEEASLGLDSGLYAQVYARDFVGQGDAYLIRSTINDTLLNRPSELNLAYDATFDPGTATDGIVFIFPIRFSINRIDDDGALVPLEAGDRVEVEIWSLNPQAFAFLSVARDQIQNGDNGIFQVPVANSPGNVLDLSSGEPVLGVFNVAAVSADSTRVE